MFDEHKTHGDEPIPNVSVASPIRIDSKIKTFSVVKPGSAPTVPRYGSSSAEADRRLVLTTVPNPLQNSLRWARRPFDPDGHPSRTYRVKAPEGVFTMHVVHIENDTPNTGDPFEVWVSDGAPRGLKALCKSLSMDMRSLDRGWLLAKLESLFSIPGEPFDLTLPNKQVIRCPGAVAAFARILHARCEQLGAFSDANLALTPLLDALMSRKEPKASGVGTMAWMAPISGTSYGDDFELIVKEVVAPGGRVVPQSVWLSGRCFPRSLEGLAVCLSFDLRVNDPQWSVLKLLQLVDMDEPQGDFWTSVPGGDKSKNYPSIVAYIGELLLYQLRVLGIIDGDLKPTTAVGSIIFDEPDIAVTRSDAVAGAVMCPSCHSISMFFTEGCCSCTSCGYSRC